jgi:hypothetical protein
MRALVKMLGGVLILRRITATHIPAHHAQAQMHPSVAHLHALFANPLARSLELDLIQVPTFF